MNRLVVLEIGNSTVKAGLIEASSLPLKKFSSWFKKDTQTWLGIKDNDQVVVSFNEMEHLRVIKNNELVSLDLLLQLIEYTLTTQLSISKESFEQVQLSLVLPSQLISVQLPLRARILKSVYERFNFGTVFLAEVSCMAALGSAHGTALVINFELEGCEVAAVNDFSIVPSTVEYFPVGSAYLYNYCKDDSSFETESDLETAKNGFMKHFVLERSEGGLNLLNVIESIINRLEPDRRSITLNHIILNGTFVFPYPVMVACLQNALLNSSLLAASDYSADTQPSSFAFKSIPEYYNEIKETGSESIAYFGASLTGKYAHSDIIRNSKN